ncbi:MAG: hypothetical protein WBA10_16735 [Elainellaceae cyanobacterium]
MGKPETGKPEMGKPEAMDLFSAVLALSPGPSPNVKRGEAGLPSLSVNPAGEIFRN